MFWTDEEYGKMRSLLDDFERGNYYTGAFVEEEPTLFDVAGYPHYENVITNYLAFFFSPDKPHGVGDLWIRSLMECYGEYDNSFGAINEIIREYPTSKGNRIDLIITTDKNVIAIENKIYAETYNDFVDYDEEAKTILDNRGIIDQNPIDILLTIKPVGDKENFKNITYEAFIDKVEKNLHEYYISASPKWFSIMQDLVKNLRGLMEKEIVMDKEWNRFLRNHMDDIYKFDEKRKADTDFKKKFLREVNSVLLEDDESGLWVNHNTYFTEEKKSYILYVELADDEDIYAIELSFSNQLIGYKSPGVLYIGIWKKKGNKSKSNEWLFSPFKKVFPGCKNDDEWGKGKGLLIEEIDFCEDDAPTAKDVTKIIIKIANEFIRAKANK